MDRNIFVASESNEPRQGSFYTLTRSDVTAHRTPLRVVRAGLIDPVHCFFCFYFLFSFFFFPIRFFFSVLLLFFTYSKILRFLKCLHFQNFEFSKMFIIFKKWILKNFKSQQMFNFEKC
jgi:hypothetical protein